VATFQYGLLSLDAVQTAHSKVTVKSRVFCTPSSTTLRIFLLEMCPNLLCKGMDEFFLPRSNMNMTIRGITMQSNKGLLKGIIELQTI